MYNYKIYLSRDPSCGDSYKLYSSISSIFVCILANVFLYAAKVYLEFLYSGDSEILLISFICWSICVSILLSFIGLLFLVTWSGREALVGFII